MFGLVLVVSAPDVFAQSDPREFVYLIVETNHPSEFDIVLTEPETYSTYHVSIDDIQYSETATLDVPLNTVVSINPQPPENFDYEFSCRLGDKDISGFVIDGVIFCDLKYIYTEPPELISGVGTLEFYPNGDNIFSKPTDVSSNPNTNQTFVLNSGTDDIVVLSNNDDSLDVVSYTIPHNYSIDFIEVNYIRNYLCYINTDDKCLVSLDLSSDGLPRNHPDFTIL